MIGTIRKHSKWLWWFIAGLTIISFVFFMGTGPARNRNGGGEGNYGTIYGQPVSDEELAQARHDFELFYRSNEGAWPEESQTLSPAQLDQQTYLNILLSRKAKSMGITISDQAVVTAASEMLASPTFNRAMGNRSNQPLDMNQLMELLKNQHLTDLDFQHYVRFRLMVEQLQLTIGLAGALVTPQEASALYDHDHSLASVQAVFFSASNYLDHVSASPAAVAGFFTNYMADYRLPDRVQVNYVWLNITNFMAQSKAEWAKTNFETMVDSVARQNASQFTDAKTPDEVKAKVRDLLIKRRAYQDAAEQAQAFVATLYAMDPVKLENFAAAAKQKGLTVHTSAPFSESGDEQFPNAPDVTKAAFALRPDSPFSEAIAGGDGIYVIGLAAQFPSSMPSYDEISARVTQDFKMVQAAAMSRAAATNFYFSATVQIATGKTLAQAAVAKGITPVTPEPFSLSSSDIPELGDHTEINPFKQVSFTVPPGNLSRVIPTAEGAFLVYVKSITPPDAATRASGLAEFTSELRRSREGEAFNMWINGEATHEFAHIPALQREPSAAR